MKNKIIYQAVIFDMDGVITDTMPYHVQAWKEVLAQQGIKVNDYDIYKREGQKGIDSVREMAHEHGVLISDLQAKEMLTKKEELFKSIFKRRYIVGSRPFIKQLKQKGFRLGLVTGTSRHEAKKLLPQDLWECFDTTVCGCDVANGKPHPEPYLTALKNLKIQPSTALVIENAPFGIRSAKAAGCACAAIATSLPQKFLNQADVVVTNYQQLSQYLKEYV